MATGLAGLLSKSTLRIGGSSSHDSIVESSESVESEDISGTESEDSFKTDDHISEDDENDSE